MIPTDMTIDPTLRERAEGFLGKTRTDIQAMNSEEVLKVIHTLQMRIIELTLQNKAWSLSQSEADISHQQYLKLFDFAPVAYLQLDEDGIIMQANLMAANFMGCERSILKKQKLSKLIKPEFQDACHLHVRSVFRTDSAQSCELQMIGDNSRPLLVSSRIINAPDPVCFMVLSDMTTVK